MENTGERRHWHFGHLLALAAICYFIPFVAVYLDEEVLETNWYQSLGGEANVIFQGSTAHSLTGKLFRPIGLTAPGQRGRNAWSVCDIGLASFQSVLR